MVALSTTLASAVFLLGSAAALGTNYQHDGATTYCWAIPKQTNDTKLTETARTTAYSGAGECPMEMTLKLSNTTIHAFDELAVTWTVTADFTNGNAINNTRLYLGPDSTGRMDQIVHSNVHSCVYGTGCDPFNDGEQLVDKTVNKVANFSDNEAIFSDSLQFPTPGEYSVLAHIILPNYNSSSRFDYAVYTKLVVLAATTAPAPTAAPEVATPEPSTAAPVTTASSSSGLSQEATIGIIVGVVVVVVAIAVIVVVLRRRNGNASNANHSGYTQAPAHDLGGDHGGYKPSNVTNTNSTTGFESAWGGPSGHRPTNASLDNTNNSTASSEQYAAPRPTNDMSQYSSSMHQPDMSASAYYGGSSQGSSQPTAARKKRIDSDVEL